MKKRREIAAETESDRTDCLFLLCIYRHLVHIQMGYLAAANTAEPVSKSALLFLEGIHQNSVNFDNPPLSPAHCQTQSVKGGEERRREERRREESYI